MSLDNGDLARIRPMFLLRPGLCLTHKQSSFGSVLPRTDMDINRAPAQSHHKHVGELMQINIRFVFPGQPSHCLFLAFEPIKSGLSKPSLSEAI